MDMYSIFLAVDPRLIWFYRMTGVGILDFLVGTFVLATLAVVIGELTISLAFLALRNQIERNNASVVKYHNLSVDALAARDKASYKAANKMANDTYGKAFFLQVGLSGAFLWPLFVALAWMNERFADIEFELLFTGYTVGYACMFILLYAAAFLIFKRIKYKLPYFRRMKRILDSCKADTSKMKSFDDLLPVKQTGR